MTELNFKKHGEQARLAHAVYTDLDDLKKSSLANDYDIREGRDNDDGNVVHVFENKDTGVVFVTARGTDGIEDWKQYDEVWSGKVTELGALTAAVAQAEYERTGKKVVVLGQYTNPTWPHHRPGRAGLRPPVRYPPHSRIAPLGAALRSLRPPSQRTLKPAWPSGPTSRRVTRKA
ncbi:MAG: hypothetical protein GDA36_11375 [Rhodobacteraceae bacterium]|nr:hypothetical protein [Paracoccaceae bacterium]